MSDLPTIDDLLKKNKADDASDVSDIQVPEEKHVDLHISTPEMEEKFKKKMGQVKVKEKERKTAQKAASLSLPHIDLEKFPVSQEALKQIDLEKAKELSTICFYSTPDEFKLGTTQPEDSKVLDLVHELEERKHAEAALYVISENSLERVLTLYKNLPIVKEITKDVEVKEEDIENVQADITDFSSFQEKINNQNTSDLLALLLGAGLKLNASDIHVEPEENSIQVRFRLDGVLHETAVLQEDFYKKLLSRVKLTSSLKLNVTDNPQDGRFTIKLKSGEVDVRVSTIPTVYGESIVMRLLGQTSEGLDFEKLGFDVESIKVLEKEIKRPNGMVVVTGPTGSGKTTTLYTMLNILNEPKTKIVTLEDPVEYKLEGINQSQIDAKEGFTFASGLRSILRQDPDVVMVGEIRDLETAETAVQAALTGHLMFSTVHTNSAAGAIPRFLSMGVKPFLLAPSLNLIIGQRLVRRVCGNCKKEQELSTDQKKQVEEIISSMPERGQKIAQEKEFKFYTGEGCDKCGGIGYKGRVAIYEILQVNKEIEDMISSSQITESQIEDTAIKSGMLTMVQDGLLKAMDGLTSLEEVFRVID